MGIGHFSDRLDGSKTARGEIAAVFGPRAGPRRRPRRAEKTARVSSFPGAPVWLRLDPDRRMSPVKLRLDLLDPEIFPSTL